MRWSVIEYHGIPWNIEERHHGTSMEYLWNIFGPPMNIKQYHGMPIEEHVTSKDYLWNSYEIMKFKGTSWFIHWQSMEYLIDVLWCPPRREAGLPRDDNGSLNALKGYLTNA